MTSTRAYAVIVASLPIYLVLIVLAPLWLALVVGLGVCLGGLALFVRADR